MRTNEITKGVNLYEKIRGLNPKGPNVNRSMKSEEMSKEGLDVGGKPWECDVLEDKLMKYAQKEKVNNGVEYYWRVT